MYAVIRTGGKQYRVAPGDVLKDSVSTHKGLAIKIFDVAGERLPGADGHRDCL